MTARGQLFIVSAPSGAGKTSLVKALVDTLRGIEVSVSYTTRTRRNSEKPGMDYHFTDAVGFQEIINNDGFLEHATVFGNSYGTSRALVEEKLAQSVDVILEIDWQGALQVRESMADCCTVFVLPPSKEVLEDRLRGRGQDSEEVIEKRMKTAVDEMSHYNEYDYLVVNDDFDTALEELIAIVKCQRLSIQRSKRVHSNLIKQLLN
ncbi:MAG: guanylate kinase [Cycloclasticus sp.]|nr:guanylate kinase [Cycloclasticus sp.]